MTVKQYKKIIQGKRNRAAGQQFEQLIDVACEYYSMTGQAEIEKTPEPMRVIQALDRTKGIYKAVFEKKAQPDYTGVKYNGRAVMFDAKSTDTDRIKQDAVSDRQWEKLDKMERMGATCFILVQLNTKGIYRVPWFIWKDLKDHFGHKYMNEADLERFMVEYRDGIVRFLDD
jgi:recombination protein U